MNKKGQFFMGGLIDASTLPKWLLYPLMFLVMCILFVVTIMMFIFIYSWFKGDVNFMPFGMFGYGYGFPIGGIGISKTVHSSSQCFENGIKVNCTEFKTIYPDYEHFITDDGYEVNGVCPGMNTNKTVQDCMNEQLK